MRLARELEKRLERLVEGVSGAIFRGKVHPVDLGTRLIREADLKIVEGPAGPVIPNEFVVALSADDLATAGPIDKLGEELAFSLTATAAERGWRLEGPSRITVTADAAVKANHLKLVSGVAPGELPPWGQLIGTGRHAELGHNRVLLGRADDCDVRLAEPEVSRRHAIIHREAQRTWITDLESANGTTVDGVGVTTTTALRPGARLALGPATFMFRLVES